MDISIDTDRFVSSSGPILAGLMVMGVFSGFRGSGDGRGLFRRRSVLISDLDSPDDLPSRKGSHSVEDWDMMTIKCRKRLCSPFFFLIQPDQFRSFKEIANTWLAVPDLVGAACGAIRDISQILYVLVCSIRCCQPETWSSPRYEDIKQTFNRYISKLSKITWKEPIPRRPSSSRKRSSIFSRRHLQ